MNNLLDFYKFLTKIDEENEAIEICLNNTERVLTTLNSIVIVEKEKEISFLCLLTKQERNVKISDVTGFSTVSLTRQYSSTNSKSTENRLEIEEPNTLAQY